jgi:hypothetical protein
MKRKRYTEEPIIGILKEHEAASLAPVSFRGTGPTAQAARRPRPAPQPSRKSAVEPY